MEPIAAVTTIIGSISAICAVIFGYIAFHRNKTIDDCSEAKQDGVVLTELGYIKSGVDDIKRKQDKQEQQHIEVVTRLTTVEESTKQAHHRIDELRSSINK